MKKLQRRLDDEFAKPLASYRHEELQWMRVNFFGPDPAYHEARRRFVFKGFPPMRPSIAQTSPSQPADEQSANWASARETLVREAQPIRPSENGRESFPLAQAWTDLLQVTIRRLFAAAR